MTATLPKVTVVIPCYNRSSSVMEAVESVLNQDYPEFDVIVVDDHSTDDTLNVLQTIAHPRVRAVSNAGDQGPGQTRNFGANLVTAPWIAFQDSDDIWLDGKLSKQMEHVLSDDRFVAVYCGMLVKDDAKPDTPVHERAPDATVSPLEGDIRVSLAYKSLISTQMLIVRRDVFETIGGFDENMPALEDWDLALRIAGQGLIAFVDENLVVQRMSLNSITRSSEKRIAAQAYMLRKHEVFLKQHPKVLGHHHHRLAGAYRQFGQFGDAVRHAIEAWKNQRLNLRYLVNIGYLRLREIIE